MIARFWSRLIAQRGARLGIGLIAALLALSALAPLVAPQDPADPLGFDPTAANHDPTLTGTYLLGADDRGRGVLALLIWGGRATLAVGLGSALLAALLGIALGALAGLRGGLTAALIGRAMDLIQAVPPVLPALLLFAKLGGLDVPQLVTVFAATGWVAPARISSASVAEAGGSDYAEAARAAGVGGARLVARHLLPGALAGVAAWIASAAATYVALEAGLDFLGLGLGANTISWGTALVGAQDALAAGNWWWLVFGGLAPAIAALALSAVAGGLARAIDPAAPVGRGARRGFAARRSDAVVSEEADGGEPAPAAIPSGIWQHVPVRSAPGRRPRMRVPMLPIVLVAALAIAGIGIGATQQRGAAPDAAMLIARATMYPSRSDAGSYIANASYVADATLLAGQQVPWMARASCPADLHAAACAHSEVQLWFNHGQGRALVEGGTFVCGRDHSWGVNPMAGLARTTDEGCEALGPDLRGLGFTAGTIRALLPALDARRARVIGQEQVAAERCWEIALPPAGRACIDEAHGLLLQLERLDHANLPVARFAVTSIAFGLSLAPELFADPIPGGHGPLLDGLSQPLLTIQAADDVALFTALVPSVIPRGLTAQTPTFDSFYNSEHGYALEQRVRQAYVDGRGRVALVIVETLPGSGWDATPAAPPRYATVAGRRVQIWPATRGTPALARVERIGTAALVFSHVLPLATVARVAAGLQ